MVAELVKETRDSDFQTAEKVTKILGDHDKPTQERILRWVTEKLGLAGTGLAPSPRPPISTAQQQEIEDTSTTPKDIRTFYGEKRPTNDVHFVAFVAYYYQFIAPAPDRKDTITGNDIQNAARLAPRSVFTSPNVPLSNAVKQGYIDRVGGGQFRINAVGENLVAMALPSASADSQSNRKQTRRKNKKLPTKKTTSKKKSRTS